MIPMHCNTKFCLLSIASLASFLSLIPGLFQHFFQFPAYGGWIRFPLHSLHRLAYKRSDRFFLSSFIVRHRLGILRDHLFKDLCKKIGRASCREGVEICVRGVAVEDW